MPEVSTARPNAASKVAFPSWRRNCLGGLPAIAAVSQLFARGLEHAGFASSGFQLIGTAAMQSARASRNECRPGPLRTSHRLIVGDAGDAASVGRHVDRLAIDACGYEWRRLTWRERRQVYQFPLPRVKKGPPFEETATTSVVWANPPEPINAAFSGRSD